MSLSCMSQLRIDGAQSIGSVQAVAKSCMGLLVAKPAAPLLLFTECGKHVRMCMLDAECCFGPFSTHFATICMY